MQDQRQQPEFPKRKLTQYVHKAWTFNGSLPGTRIQAITQTADGFLWIGTDGGLARFDGLNFKYFDPATTPSFTTENIHSLAAGPEGSLWIGTEDGLLRLKDGIFTRYTERDGLGSSDIYGLHFDGNGTLRVGAKVSNDWQFKLSRWSNGRFVTDTERADFLASQDRQCFGQSMLRDHNGNIWNISFHPLGLNVLVNGQKTRYTTADGLSSNVIGLLFEDERGTIWIATSKGVDRFVAGKFLQYRLKPNGSEPQVTCLSEDKHGDVWFVTRNQGLFLWSSEGVSRFTVKEGLSGDYVYVIFVDREDNHWIITDKGLDLFQEGFITPYGRLEGIADDNIVSLMAAHDGSVWAGTWNGKLYHLQKSNIKEYKGVTTPPHATSGIQSFLGKGIVSIYQTSDHTIWISSISGLKVLKESRLAPLPSTAESRLGTVETMYEDPQQALWLGTEHGLLRLKDGVYTRYATIPGAAINAISVIVGSADGSLWLGTSGGGLRHFTNGTFQDYGTSDGLSHNLITALLESADGTLWIGTPRGLNSFKDGRFTRYSNANHGLESYICAVLEDNDGYLWMSTSKGIFRAPIVDLEGFAAGKLESWSYTSYGTEDGMRNVGCSEGTHPTGVKDRLGNLWFATGTGIVHVDPLKVSRAIPLLQVLVDRVSADLMPVDPVRGGSVPPGKNALEFHYTVPSFRVPHKIEFRYKLIPFDERWNAVGARRSAFYTNLPPGTYRFQVQVRNINGMWNQPGASVELKLRAHFYQMLWFYVFCLFVLISALTGLYLMRKRQLAAQMQQRLEERLADRTRIAQEIHDTFLQDIVGLVFNIEVASNELPLRPGAAKTRLKGVLDQLRQTVAAGRRALTDLRSPNISYGDLAKALVRLGEQMRSETGPGVAIHIEGDIGWLPPLIGDEVFQIGREALFNAIRHARAKDIDLTLSCTENSLTLRIVDDGSGIAPEVLRRGRPGHFGLQGMKERAERVNGHFKCCSSEGDGTEITLRVPLPASRAKHSSIRFLYSISKWLSTRNEKNSETQIR